MNRDTRDQLYVMTGMCICSLVSISLFGGNTFKESTPLPTEPSTQIEESSTEEPEAVLSFTHEELVEQISNKVFETEKESYTETEISTEESTEESPAEIETESETPMDEPEHELPIYHTVTECMMNPDLQLWVIHYAEGRGVDPYLIMAMCEKESCCKYDIIGDNGNSYGIMQVQPKWQSERLRAYGLTPEDLLYPQNCIMIGTDILLEYRDKGYSLEYMLMCYNGGEPYAQRQTQVSEYALWVINRANELRTQGVY